MRFSALFDYLLGGIDLTYPVRVFCVVWLFALAGCGSGTLGVTPEPSVDRAKAASAANSPLLRVTIVAKVRADAPTVPVSGNRPVVGR